MTKKIFRSIFLVALLTMICSIIIIMGLLYKYFSDKQMEQLKEETNIVKHGFIIGGINYLNSLKDSNFRITWINSNGVVEYDNKADIDSMDSHLERKEIKDAYKNGYGESSRYSTTLMEKQLYYAIKLSDGGIIRLSGTQLTWWKLLLSMFQPISIVILIAVFVSFSFAYALSKRIVKPLNSLDFDNISYLNDYEELNTLINHLQSQQQRITEQRNALLRKTEEFEIATMNMNEGIVLLNENGTVLSINNSALKILEISRYCIGKDLLLIKHTDELSDIIKNAQSGKRSEAKIKINDFDYRFSATPIIFEQQVKGIALIIFDITESEKTEQIKKEFTANVSHELKTPLQCISGYSELLANSMVPAEEISNFCLKINSEAKRMINLVEDIITISQLEEYNKSNSFSQKEKVNLLAISQNIANLLYPVAMKKNVQIIVTGKPIEIYGIEQLISAIISNLCDNAIKYNKENGKVIIDISEDEIYAILTVKDTGIGIKPEHLSRIFERFYRVDKSRSKESGGTGLGLSIVRHSAILHDAPISMESIYNEGTKITIKFPK